ncbi:MAG: glycosyltransferase family 4 protein [Flavobacteriales bacterium]|nr:glycosyltransferase family 4 protein [Flavobacteriales bacterium]MCW8937686.1 glycosyltransferase family 4 protein [Flavobacteriales bacterium]MCW8969503.1 glycosyltransferase family 4 protein [Flavobacteriales bacterium]MCW8990174.1 glycosyltransferase family 4 protein [Flavobacteriales bacterium]MCW9019892.1 glycosyltransferase family 4 protein [Flavobacteriales bacterium]
MKKKVAYFLSHPIQYQTPLLQKLNTLENIDLQVIYFTDHTIGGLDRQFGINVTWDIPLLNGYNYIFLKNYAKKPAVSGKFWGLINWGIFNYLIKYKPDVIIMHGWGYFSNILLLTLATILRIKVIMRAESPLKQEKNKGKLNTLLKKTIIKLCYRFVYIGKENKAFYKSLGVKEHQLFYAPYCVDNKRFIETAKTFNRVTDDIRIKYQIPTKNRIALFCGKFITKKRPLDILEAYVLNPQQNLSFVFVGTGVLETKMKQLVKKYNLENVHFAGFVNQTELYKYYISADFFILPSGYGETWGLVVNEAMVHSLPVLISDEVGCTANLVHEGVNGFTYPYGNLKELNNKLTFFSEASNEKLKEMGENSFEIIQQYSYDETLIGFKKAIFS